MEECLGCGRPDTFGVHLRPSMKEIQGERIEYETEKFHCTACEAEWMSPTQADIGFKKAVTLFLTKHGMLTGEDCEQRRKKIGWTQQDLVNASGVSSATIKRLESGVHILTKAHNDATERALEAGERNRAFVNALALSWEKSQAVWTAPADWSIGTDLQSAETVMPESESMALAADSNELALAA